MSRLSSLSPWLVALTALWFVGAQLAGAAQNATSAEKVEPYTGPPIFLDEQEAPPAAKLVDKRVDTEKYENGNVRHEREIARYSDNSFVADGYYREFYPDGKKFSEGQYKNGRQVGKWTYWHANGQVNREVNYKDGQPDGNWDVFNADGAVIAKRSYKDGRRDGAWTIYDKTGKQIVREEQYVDGKPEGTWKAWFPTGQLQTEMGFKQGVRHGSTTVWDEKGSKRAELNYVDGKVQGTATLWGTDGRKIVQQYDQGKLVSEAKE